MTSGPSLKYCLIAAVFCASPAMAQAPAQTAAQCNAAYASKLIETRARLTAQLKAGTIDTSNADYRSMDNTLTNLEGSAARAAAEKYELPLTTCAQNGKSLDAVSATMMKRSTDQQTQARTTAAAAATQKCTSVEYEPAFKAVDSKYNSLLPIVGPYNADFIAMRTRYRQNYADAAALFKVPGYSVPQCNILLTALLQEQKTMADIMARPDTGGAGDISTQKCRVEFAAKRDKTMGDFFANQKAGKVDARYTAVYNALEGQITNAMRSGNNMGAFTLQMCQQYAAQYTKDLAALGPMFTPAPARK